MNTTLHWTQVYQTKAVDEVSWYQERPELSLAFIDQAHIARDAAIIDVGAGASTLVDHLVASGYTDITLLDLSEAALNTARARLGAVEAQLKWLVGDITSIALPQHRYDLWHDRAVFHFLTIQFSRSGMWHRCGTRLNRGDTSLWRHLRPTDLSNAAV